MNLEGDIYLRNGNGKVFGPVSMSVLQKWACDGRVEPTAQISSDLKEWIAAPNIPALGMEWVVENNPGQFYGPTHRAVIDDFIKSGTLAVGARFYRDMRGGLAERAEHEAALRAEMEQAQAEREKALQVEHEHALNEVKAEVRRLQETYVAERTAAEDARVHAAQQTADVQRELEAARAEVAALKAARAELEETLAATQKERDELKEELGPFRRPAKANMDVVVPEVIISDEPPPKPLQGFGPAPKEGAPSLEGIFGGKVSSLADLERQAQAELARMRAAGGGGFFGFGRKK